MKKILLISIFSTIAIAGNCQRRNNKNIISRSDSVKRSEEGFMKGQIYYGVGMGIFSLLNNFPIPDNGQFTSGVPPVRAFVEFGVSDKLSIGFYYGESYAGVTAGSDKSTYIIGIIGVKCLYYIKVPSIKLKHLDIYAGGVVGLKIVTGVDNSFLPEVVVGAKYHFSKSVSVFGEIGYGASVLNFGLNFRVRRANRSKLKWV